MSKQKVVILGAKGMLGQDLVDVFGGDEKYEVFAWDMGEIDITDFTETKNKIDEVEPDLIINAVGYNAVDKAEEDDKEFDLAMKINADAPENLAKIAKDLDVVFVHYVSDYVFDGKKGEYDENDETCPISRYGKSKADGEVKVLKLDGKNYLIRTSKLFGRPAQSATAKKSFFEIMLNLSKENSELKVVDSEKSCFTYTPDLAMATKDLVEKRYDFGIYHLVNEGAVTWYGGVQEFFEIMGIEDVELLPVSPAEFPRSAKRPESSILQNTKFPKLRHYSDALRDWAKFF